MSHVFSGLGQLASPWAYVIVGVLAALEASAFVGLFVPGEIALLAGGYVVQQGHASLPPMLIAAALGAVLGDSVGYEIGRRFGPRLQRSRLGRRVGEDRWNKAQEFLHRRGGAAIFLGRFVGVLRALVPAVAGTSRMPYRRFLFWNALGGLLWAPGMVLLGYFAGSSYRRIEHYAGRASLVLLLMVVVCAGIVWSARRIAGHQDAVRHFLDRQASRPRVARLRGRYRRELDFLLRRFDRNTALGVSLSLTLVALVVLAWAFGSLVIDLLSNQDVAGPDHATLAFMVAHRAAWLNAVMRVGTSLGSGLVLVPLSLVVAAIWRWRRRDWSAAWLLGATYGGASLSFNLVKRLTARRRPAARFGLVHAGGYAFPSGHATQAVAVWGALAFLASRVLTRWSRKVGAWSAAIIVSGFVGLSRLYLGVHWLSDVAAGWALGGLWLFALIAIVQLLGETSGDEPAGPPGQLDEAPRRSHPVAR